MLLRIALSIKEVKLKSKINRILSGLEIFSQDVKPSEFIDSISPEVCDGVILDHCLVTRKIINRVQSLKSDPNGPVIIVISDIDDPLEHAELITSGFDTVLSNSLSIKKLKDAINTVLEKKRISREASLITHRELGQPSLQDFVSESPVMKEFMRIARRVVKSRSSVLILGETGVGKERLAHAIHSEGPRSDGPFVSVNCGALPETLLESELFGHEQGAFTGATKTRRGCFEMAHGGTIFLDEIGEIPIHLQVKLLRVLENREIKPLGSEKAIPVDVRIMAATNRDIEQEVEQKNFRKDLFYRLNVVSLSIPALRNRKEDIPELINSYIRYLGPKINSSVADITQKAIDMLINYSWPGNVRELINVIERAMLLCESDTINCEDLPASISGYVVLPATSETSKSLSLLIPDQWLARPLKEAQQTLLDQFEPIYLASVLKACQGKIGIAAQKAGINERTLFNKMKLYDLKKEDFK